MGHTVTWYEFTGPNVEARHAAFLAWHQPVCAAESIPRPGRNQRSGAVDVDACWTDAYANAWLLVDERVVVSLADGDPHAAGLTPTVVDPGNGLDDRGDLEGAVIVTDPQPHPTSLPA
jgi:hypothetical protein